MRLDGQTYKESGVDTTITHEGRTFHKQPEGFHGKKNYQVAGILKRLQENPGVPLPFEDLCLEVDQKYPQDVQAAAMALFMVEYVEVVKTPGDKKTYLVWVGPVDPTNESA